MKKNNSNRYIISIVMYLYRETYSYIHGSWIKHFLLQYFVRSSLRKKYFISNEKQLWNSSLFVKGAGKVLNQSEIFFFANDMKFLIQIINPSSDCYKLQSDFNILVEWSQSI